MHVLGRAALNYAEQLPPKCPPDDAGDMAHESLYRLMRGDKVLAEEFHSHALLGRKNRTKANDCSFASCSLLGDYKKFLADLPNLRSAHTHVARLSIPEGYGLSKSKAKKENIHVDFWCFSGKSLTDCVVEIFPLEEEEQDA